MTDEKGNYSYGSKKQRLESDWRFNYLYDNNGNMVSKVQRSDSRKITNYEYSSENQLLAIKEYDGPTLLKESFYGYDALGRRVLKEHVDHLDDSKSFTKKFVYDGQSILFEVNGDNDLLATYTHSLNRIDDVLAMDRNNTSYFYLKDHLGTINEIMNSSGSVVQRYVYSAFGEILKTEDGNGQALASPAVENFFTFTGRESDFESGLNYYRARYYDASVGRFVQSDPDAGSILSPNSFNNKYSYVGNHPLNYVDPSGKIKLKTFIAGYFLGVFNYLYVAARSTFFNGKIGDRFDNLVISSAALVFAFKTAPITAGVALLTTGVQNRNKKGNFFDNLDDFTMDFSMNFSIALTLNAGWDIDPKSAGGLFGYTLPVNALYKEIGQGAAGVFAKEILCNNKKHIPLGVKEALDGLGLVANRGREQCR
nr:hypothetical protein BHI3_19110 [Bacteriovorax sp. HI3]